MMTVSDLKGQVQLESEIVYCYFDYSKEKLIEITEKQAAEKEIKYIYCTDNKLHIEVENE